MKRLLLAVLLVAIPFFAKNQETEYITELIIKTTYCSENEFIQTMITELQEFDLSEDEMITLIAQAALESNYGKCRLSRYNNVFGITGRGITTKTKEYINGEYIVMYRKFRRFNSIKDCIVERLKIKNLHNYATAPNYWEVVEKVKKSIKRKLVITTYNTFSMTKKEQIEQRKKELEELVQVSSGLAGDFECPFGSKDKYQLRIYKSLITDHLVDYQLHDYNESYELWRNKNKGIIVVKDI